VSADARVEAYAKLLVDRCLDVQPGMQVVIRTTPHARPAVLALERELARRGAYAILRISFVLSPSNPAWAREAPMELLAEMSEIDKFTADTMDARILIDAPENTRDGSDLPSDRFATVMQTERYFYRRTMPNEIPWVSCAFPTQALAQEASLTLEQFEEVFYGACLVDWDEEGRRLTHYASRFDAAETVRIVGTGTDLTLSLAGRTGKVDDGHENMPGGEFFFSPLEDSATGTIEFSEFPSSYRSQRFTGIRLTFRDGVVVDASAATNESMLYALLDRDEGARRIGELGIGCNRAIPRPMNHVLFDEKMQGSIHIALGQSYEIVSGTNQSAIHWDIVKILREGGRIELDGEIVQENGAWLI
jgi:aminopeptidase